MARLNTEDQDGQVQNSISLCCCADTDIGFSYFLINSLWFFCAIIYLCWTGLAKSTVVRPFRTRKSWQNEEKKHKEHERRACSLFVIMILKVWATLSITEPFV